MLTLPVRPRHAAARSLIWLQAVSDRRHAGHLTFARTELDEPQQRPELSGREGTCTVNWYLPPFASVYAGVRTALRVADHLKRRHGLRQRFVICGRGADRERARGRIAETFGALAESELLCLGSLPDHDEVPSATFSVATFWTTAYYLLPVRNTAFKYYLVQDWEPDFYPAGSKSMLARETHEFGFATMTNTSALLRRYERETGRSGMAFEPCVDTTMFHPPTTSRDASGPKRVFFYGRPWHPRNCFPLLAEALGRLKQHCGGSVEIVSAGANWRPRLMGLGGVAANFGLLPYEAVGALYRSCHIGLFFQASAHPGYTPFELMASGVLLIANRRLGASSAFRQGETCLLTFASAESVAETLIAAVQSYDALAELRHRACKEVLAKHADWTQQMEAIAGHMLSGLPESTRN